MKKKQVREFEMFVEMFVPKFLINSTETHLLKGTELIEWGVTHDPDNPEVPIIPTATYKYKQPVQTEVNHVRRIKNAWKANGREGVNHYLGILGKKLNGLTIVTENP